MSYVHDPDLWDEAAQAARNCEECRIDELTVSSGAARQYEFCTPHHREFYRRYVTAHRPESRLARVPTSTGSVRQFFEGGRDPADITQSELDDLIHRLERDSDDEDAARDIAHVSVSNPERVLPAVSGLLGVLQAYSGSNRPLWAASAALARLAPLDADIVGRVLVLLDDGDRDIRYAAIRTLVKAAKHRPEALLTAECGSPDRFRSLLNGLGSERPEQPLAVSALTRAYATRGLVELARADPESVAPSADTLAELLSEEYTFHAAVTLGLVSLARPEVVEPYADDLAALLNREDESNRAAGRIALTYLASQGVRSTDESLPSLLSEIGKFADPSEQSEEEVREAVYALGVLGNESDIDRLAWIRDCAFDADLEETAIQSLRRLGVDAENDT